MARAATSPEIALFRTAGQWSRYRAAIYTPSTVYTGRVNQTFSTVDRLLGFTYDGGSGTLANVLEGMTVYIGSTAGAWDKGIARVRGIDASFVHIGETSDIAFANDDHFTIVDSFELWARPAFIDSGIIYMDGGVVYSDQHSNYLPLIRGGPNRVIEKTGATVSLSFDFPATVPGSSVSSRSTTAPGSTGITGGTTQTPSITWNSVGWKIVYHTVTAANGKSNFIVRYVFVWDSTNLPEPILHGSRRADVESGGWEVSLTLFDNASISEVRDQALIVIFAEDHYGATETQIGPVTGAENIVFNGWIAGESIDWNSQGGSVSFTAYTAHYFLQRIPAWPDGVRFTAGTPTNWTEIQSLTVDLGLIHHFLMWRSTAPRIIDIYGTDDSRFSKEVGSLASTLWDQIREMSFEQIFARALCNRLNQLYIEIHPQLVPAGSRTWPTVVTLEEQDIEDGVDLRRRAMEEASIVDLSGVAINSSGVAAAYFALSPGHAHSHYGSPIIQGRVLLASQAQANELAGLFRGWKNNPYESIELRLASNNRLVDIAPRQKCVIAISSGDTIRGISGSLGLLPLSINETFDARSGYSHPEITFEVETFQDLATIGDTPGSGDVSIPPLPPLPPLPPFDSLFPGIGIGVELPAEETTPTRVLVHDTGSGLVYTANFDAVSPTWITVNSGLTPTQYTSINKILIDPSGGVYVAYRNRNGFGPLPFVAYAPSIGATFTVIEDGTTIAARFPSITPDFYSINGIGMNPLTGQVLYIIGIRNNGGTEEIRPVIGSGLSFTMGSLDLSTPINISAHGTITFGFNQWRLSTTRNNTNQKFMVLDAAATSIVFDSGDQATTIEEFHLPISTTDELIGFRDDGLLHLTANATLTAEYATVIGSGVNTPTFLDNHFAIDPTGFFIMGDWDTGQRGKTSDKGATWVGMPGLIFGGSYAYAYAGGVGAASRWIAARGTIQYSEDFGSNWISTKIGNYLTIDSTPIIDIVKAVGYGV